MIRKLEKMNMTKSIYHYNELRKKVFGINRKMRGDCSLLSGDCSKLYGDCSELRGDCTELRGDCTGLCGGCSELSGDFDMCEITAEERAAGLLVNDLVFKSEEEK